MKENLFEFLSFAYPNIKYVVLGTLLLSISSALVGCFTFLKKKSLVGDVVAHSVLPGICLGFLVAGYKNPVLIIIGAFITGWLSIMFMDYVVNNSKIKEDTATGLSLSVFFGLGILLLTFIQQSGNAQQTGLDVFLFGKAAALVGDDLTAFAVIAVIVIFIVFFYFKEFTLIAFDKEFAKAIGIKTKRIELILTTVTVLAVVTGIQAVGVVLMAAMLITPAAAAKFWTHNLRKMLLLAAVFSGLAGYIGAFISYTAPSMPTGPWMVMVLSLIAVYSFMFAPKTGIVVKYFNQQKIQRKFMDENILKTFYESSKGGLQMGLTHKEIWESRKFHINAMNKSIRRLTRNGFLTKEEEHYQLSTDGLRKGKRILKLHLLWEAYLRDYLRIAPDHVHEDAETIEHVITPEVEKKLETLIPQDQLNSL